MLVNLLKHEYLQDYTFPCNPVMSYLLLDERIQVLYMMYKLILGCTCL